MSKKLLDHGLENFIYLYMAKGDQSGLEVFVSLDIGDTLKGRTLLHSEKPFRKEISILVKQVLSYFEKRG